MPKLRLTASHRQALLKLARKSIKCPKEEIALKRAYQITCMGVRAAIEKVNPHKDMLVLQKYDLARKTYPWVCLRGTYGGEVNFKFEKEAEIPLFTQGLCVLVLDETTTKHVHNWLDARAAFADAFNKKVHDYEALINASKSLEDVTAIWREAEATRAAFSGRSLTTLSQEVISRIKSCSK